MTWPIQRRSGLAAVVFIGASVVLWPSPCRSQSGPLTGTLKEEEPTDYAFRLGPLLVSPMLSVREAGIDTNVFDEPVSPKRDYMITLTPDMQFFARAGVLRFVGITSSDFTYYHKYTSERSIGRQYRGRVDAFLSRVRPWIAGAHVDSRTRPNDEIDLRAHRSEMEVSAGVGFEISPLARLFVTGSRLRTDYSDNQVFHETNLADTLNRRDEAVSGGVRIQATPFTVVTVSGAVAEDRFEGGTSRNAQSRGATIELEFSSEAVVRGRASLGYQEFRPNNPNIIPYRGIVGNAGLAYTLLGRATIAAEFTRGVQYSFDEAKSYFVNTGADVVWTQRLFGPYDVQGKVSRRWLDYASSPDAGVGGGDPSVNGYQVGAGYVMQNNSRIAFNFEHAERVAENNPAGRYKRQRFFGSFTYGFR